MKSKTIRPVNLRKKKSSSVFYENVNEILQSLIFNSHPQQIKANI